MSSNRIRFWIDSTTIHSCYSCGTTFNFLKRKHHCRFCGRVFCANCTNLKMKIPKLLRSELPLSPGDNYLYSLIKNNDDDRKRRVCSICASHLHITQSVEKLIQVILLCDFLDLQDYAILAQVNNKWKTCIYEIMRILKSAISILPSMNLSPLESKIIRAHSSDLYQHVQWRVLVLRVTNGIIPIKSQKIFHVNLLVVRAVIKEYYLAMQLSVSKLVSH